MECVELNSKKASCNIEWINGNSRSIFNIFSPISQNGIYNYYNVKDIPFYNSPSDVYVTILKGVELMIVFNDNHICITGSSNNTWKRIWYSVSLNLVS